MDKNFQQILNSIEFVNSIFSGTGARFTTVLWRCVIGKLPGQKVILKLSLQSSSRFLRYWPFVWGIHRSPVNSPHKGQRRWALILSLICAWTKGLINNRDAGDFRRHRAHYNVTVMIRHAAKNIQMISKQNRIILNYNLYETAEKCSTSNNCQSLVLLKAITADIQVKTTIMKYLVILKVFSRTPFGQHLINTWHMC